MKGNRVEAIKPKIRSISLVKESLFLKDILDMFDLFSKSNYKYKRKHMFFYVSLLVISIKNQVQ